MSQIKLSENFIKSNVKLALNEDLYPSGDITSGLIKNNNIIIVGNGQFKCEKIIKKHTKIFFDKNIINPSSKYMPELSNRKFINNEFEDLAYFEPTYLKEFKTNL